jgi:hypothetical protein
LEKHHVGATESSAWMLNVSKQTYPYFGFLEAFSTDPNYQTSLHVVDQNGIVDYGSNFRLFEFVDDNDDQDRSPDWQRNGSTSGDREVFPGWDENNDFISDFNQNDSPSNPNRVPDYDEPFLRYHTDRPEFLYGIDMNHNGTVDRFENDEEADLPYRRDRRGYNIYGGAFFLPEIRLTLGRQDMRQIAENGHSKADYLILTADRRFGWGRVRLFQDLRLVEDNIKDDLLQWVQLPNSRGELLPQRDALWAHNTLINTSWLGLDFTPVSGLKVKNVLKWKLYHQRDDKVELGLRGQRANASFLGLINKAKYRMQLGKLTLIPAWKSEFRREGPVDLRTPRRRELSEIFLLMTRLPVLLSSYIEGGLEHHRFSQLIDPVPPGAEDSFYETTMVAQLTNISDYQGYRLTTVLGFDMTRRHFEVEGTRTRTRGFLTVYAGVER